MFQVDDLIVNKKTRQCSFSFRNHWSNQEGCIFSRRGHAVLTYNKRGKISHLQEFIDEIPLLEPLTCSPPIAAVGATQGASSIKAPSDIEV